MSNWPPLAELCSVIRFTVQSPTRSQTRSRHGGPWKFPPRTPRPVHPEKARVPLTPLRDTRAKFDGIHVVFFCHISFAKEKKTFQGGCEKSRNPKHKQEDWRETLSPKTPTPPSPPPKRPPNPGTAPVTGPDGRGFDMMENRRGGGGGVVSPSYSQPARPPRSGDRKCSHHGVQELDAAPELGPRVTELAEEEPSDWLLLTQAGVVPL